MDALNEDEVREKLERTIWGLGSLVAKLTSTCWEHDQRVSFTVLGPSRDGDEPLAIAVLNGEEAIRDFKRWLSGRGQKTGVPIYTGQYLSRSAEPTSD